MAVKTKEKSEFKGPSAFWIKYAKKTVVISPSQLAIRTIKPLVETFGSRFGAVIPAYTTEEAHLALSGDERYLLENLCSNISSTEVEKQLKDVYFRKLLAGVLGMPSLVIHSNVTRMGADLQESDLLMWNIGRVLTRLGIPQIKFENPTTPEQLYTGVMPRINAKLHSIQKKVAKVMGETVEISKEGLGMVHGLTKLKEQNDVPSWLRTRR